MKVCRGAFLLVLRVNMLWHWEGILGSWLNVETLCGTGKEIVKNPIMNVEGASNDLWWT